MYVFICMYFIFLETKKRAIKNWVEPVCINYLPKLDDHKITRYEYKKFAYYRKICKLM